MVLNDAELATLCSSRLFASVAPERLRERLKPSGEITLRPGAVLLELGQRNAVIYLLVEGRLAVYLDREGRIPVAHVLPGECVGEISIIDDEAASASVVAVEPSRLLMTNPDHLWELMAAEHRVALNLMHILTDRIRRNNAAMLEILKQEQQLRAVATVDPLTGLNNRRWMNETFLRQIERSSHEERPLAIALIDIDHFKRVNDRHGHLVGDEMLAHVGQLILRHFRPGDLAARYGGEEFCVLLPDTRIEEAVVALERLRDRIETSPATVDGGKSLSVTISAGIAPWRKGWSLDDLVRAADVALYRAKEGGRNRVVAAA